MMRVASLALVALLATGTYVQFFSPDAKADAAASKAAVPHAKLALKVGQKAPDFTATDIEGKIHTLAQHKGQIVVLEWTNAGCPFVKKHYITKNMQNLQKEYTGKGVVWLTVNSSAEGKQGNVTADEAKQLLKDADSAPSAYLLDGKGDLGHLYGAKTTPHFFIIDKDGVLAYQGAIDDKNNAELGDVEGATPYVKNALDALLDGKKVETATTVPYGCSVKY
jgi:peroxiredoxin